MQRSFYYGLAVFLFYVILSTISVKIQNPNPLIVSVCITAMTFIWFRVSVNWERFFSTAGDVSVNIIIYTVIVSVFAMMSMAFSGDTVDITNMLLYSSSVALWFVIWTDYYFQWMKAK
jgi:hypothetical protein